MALATSAGHDQGARSVLQGHVEVYHRPGREGKERPVELMPQEVVLIAGKSGIGKSTLATALTERFIEQELQFCVFDPEGDYEGLAGAVTVHWEDPPWSKR